VIQAFGGDGRPTCQTLPFNFPGYRPYCPYTAGSTTEGMWTAPELAKARALVARSGTRGMKVTIWAWTRAQAFNSFTVKLLRSLGYRVSTKTVGGNYYGVVADSRNRAQIGYYGWGSDYPSASDFFRSLFTCASFRPGNQNNMNAGEFCDPSIDRLVERAVRVEATDPSAARDLWARVDRAVADQAPWVPLVNPELLDLLSKGVGNYQWSAGFGMLIDQLWVR
jgi:ABC-type oligopeptide transport system, periplasmic component